MHRAYRFYLNMDLHFPTYNVSDQTLREWSRVIQKVCVQDACEIKQGVQVNSWRIFAK